MPHPIMTKEKLPVHGRTVTATGRLDTSRICSWLGGGESSEVVPLFEPLLFAVDESRLKRESSLAFRSIL